MRALSARATRSSRGPGPGVAAAQRRLDGEELTVAAVGAADGQLLAVGRLGLCRVLAFFLFADAAGGFGAGTGRGGLGAWFARRGHRQ